MLTPQWLWFHWEIGLPPPFTRSLENLSRDSEKSTGTRILYFSGFPEAPGGQLQGEVGNDPGERARALDQLLQGKGPIVAEVFNLDPLGQSFPECIV